MALTVLFILAYVIFLVPKECSSSAFNPHIHIHGDMQKATRLSGNISPVYYKIDLNPTLDPVMGLSLHGSVWIDVRIVVEDDTIILHAKDLQVKKKTVKVWNIPHPESPEFHKPPRDQEPIAVLDNHHVNDDNDFYIITLSEHMLQGQFYRVFLEYSAKLSKKAEDGLLVRSYLDIVENKTKYYAVTHFQPTGARKVFPCFDEPAFKAKFQLSIARTPEMRCLSNMEIDRSNEVAGKHLFWDHFKVSLPMSTFLVGFLISEFTHRKFDAPDKHKVTVWAERGLSGHVKYAQEIAPKLVKFFEVYYDIGYPLSKLDIVAIPHRVPPSIENWGLMLFRDSIFYEPTSDHQYQQHVAEAISHGMAHQWFGNLVTQEWWNDIWLNEALSCYAEQVAVDYIEPKWGTIHQFVGTKMHLAFQLDSIPNSHPLYVAPHDSTEINQVFDEISHYKGAALIRMLSHAIRNCTFREGFHMYLSKFGCKTANLSDFWQFLTEEALVTGSINSFMDIATIMEAWTIHPGFPLVTVHRNYSNGMVTFSQKRFHPGSSARTIHHWWIPINYATLEFNTKFEDTHPHFWMSDEQIFATPEKVHLPNDTWLIVNVQQTGFYRVNYDHENWERITNFLRLSHNVIHVINRAQLIDDAFSLAKMHELNYEVALNLTMYITNENDYLPWHSFVMALRYLNLMLSHSDAYIDFKLVMQKLVTNQYNFIGFSERLGDSYLMKIHRADVSELACEVDSVDCVESAVSMYRSWMSAENPDSHNPIPVEQRRVVYTTALRTGNRSDWEFLVDRFGNCTTSSHKYSMLAAFGATRASDLHAEFLRKWLLKDINMDAHESIRFFSNQPEILSSSKDTFEFVKKHWPDISKKFEGHLAQIVRACVMGISTKEEMSELEQFFDENKSQFVSDAHEVDVILHHVNLNVKWKEKGLPEIRKWLRAHVSLTF